MPRFVPYRQVSTSNILMASGDPPFQIPVAAGQWEVNDGNQWLPAVTVAASTNYTTWAGEGWYDFSDAATVIRSGTAITGVANKRSGGGDLLANGTAGRFQFVEGGRNGLAIARLTRDVSGAADSTVPPRLTAPADAPISQRFQGIDKPYVVLSVYSPTDVNTGAVWNACAAGPRNIGLVRRNSSNCSVRKEVVPGTVNDVNFAAQPSGAWYVNAIKHSGTSVKVWNNSLTPAALLTSDAQDVEEAVSTIAFRLGVLANTTAFSATQGNIDYGEIVIDGVKTDAEIQQAITALATKWGITLS